MRMCTEYLPALPSFLSYFLKLFTAANSLHIYNIVVIQLLSHVQLFVTPWTSACQTPLSFSISQSLLEFMSIESVMPYNHLIFCCPLSLLPSIFPSITVFSSESALCIRWLFSFSINLPRSIQCWFPLGWTCWIFLQSKGLSRVFSSPTGQKHQFFRSQPSTWSNSHTHTWLLEKP